MQAASRESYAAGVERFEAHARSADPAALVAMADEILSVAALLQREPRLRRALADPARTGEDRAGLLGGLLAGKVQAATSELLNTLVSGRWSTPTDLLTAVEQIGVSALLASADRAGELGEIEDELFRFGQIVAADPQLSSLLSDPVASAERRAELARGLLEGKARPLTVRLVEVALAGFGGRSFSGALSRLVELAAERRERQIAHVTVAAPLTEEEERRLGSTLSQMYGREVSVKQHVDPEILGGMSVQVGSDLYDGTVLRRLTETRKALTQR
ncbi:MAG TPA: F0F1 ATP synthase subunit delta [Micromonosporaceae bacterium]